jgi:hypothetical protein
MPEPNGPLIITIWGADKSAYKDKTLAVKVSPDGIFMSVVLEKDSELRIYKLMDKETLQPVKNPEKPYKIIKVTEDPSTILETFFFKVQQGHDKNAVTGDYCIYMLSKSRVTLFNLDKGAKQWVLS